MTARRLAPLIIAAALLVPRAAPHAQDIRTQAPCSPVISGTQGNVTVTFSGGCSLGATPLEIQEIVENALARRPNPPGLIDRYDTLREQLGVTNSALNSFFRILSENNVPVGELDATLRRIAERHLTLLRQAEPSAADDPPIAAIKNEAVAAIGTGDYDRAETLLQRIADAALARARLRQEAANRDFLTAAKAKADLGELKLTRLQYAAAMESFREAADLVPATEALVRAQYLNRIGTTAEDVANFSLAERALSEALRIRESKLNPEHPEVAVSLNNLALLLKLTNRHSEAEPLYRRAIAIGEKSLGPDHPDVAIRLNNLARLLQDTNRLSEAEPLYRRAIAIDEKNYGPDHPDVAIDVNNLASLLQDTNRLSEAEPLLTRTLATMEKSYGTDHPNVAVALNNLARLLKDTSRLSKAEPLLRRALVIDEKSYGTNHPAVATDLNNLATLLQDTDRLREAEPLVKRALAIAERSYGPNHPLTKTIRENLQQLQAKLAGGAPASRPQPDTPGPQSSSRDNNR